MASDKARQEAKPEPRQARKSHLVEKYNKVGPAAINAALLCQKPKKKAEPKRLYEAREEA